MGQIAEATRTAPGYLVRVLQTLARAGILSARRGTQGGFRLERPPGQLTVWEVIHAVDPIERIRSCPLKLEAHGTRLCPMHRRIDEATALIERSFSEVTIQDLLVETAAQPGCQALLVQALGDVGGLETSGLMTRDLRSETGRAPPGATTDPATPRPTGRPPSGSPA